ncbi:DedA family protein [Trichocoleus desertorum AS-A10]|uniref:DedA family protein n=1 Tax=Trichocoleus desertorum TaxID=1481672 RepID=UPI0032997005
MESFSYLGIVLLTLISPLPTEVIMPLTGFMAAQGKLNLVYAVLAGVLGSVIGALPWYFAGKYLGEPGLRKLSHRSGGWIKVSMEDIEKSKYWFKQYGGRAVVLSRAVPGVRTFISVPVGISGMPVLLFLFYVVLGATIWDALLAGSGYVLGDRYYLVKQYLGPASNVVVAILLIAVVVLLFRRKIRRANKSKSSLRPKKLESKL